LDPARTRVHARLAVEPLEPGADLVLDGEGLRLISLAIDGAALREGAFAADARGLVVPAGALPPGPFTLESEVEIDPSANTALEGLYLSGGMFCTQCEAEGFRRITYYPDRPDVMAPFRVRIESALPVLLSNGNPDGAGPGWAEWDDPWPKPAYLFALVAGDLRARRGSFTTASAREVELAVWVRPGDEVRCDYALDALQRSMRWDEEVYGREYDLDVFNIVAVDDFNMGAMENKGLNIFNSKFVLASPETATDGDYDAIERIVAHEYFHNWTGNRITCRDWFQLCLKEGLTVFRDQQFSADARGASIRRIGDVMVLRARQFREDAGPLAHPVRPEAYVEINNFYTATVYEKGAELIRMLKTLVGSDGYRRAIDLYFSRHDGQACTVEDWIAVFEEATGRDLSQFVLWYSRPGTPRLSFTDEFNNGRYTITIEQKHASSDGGTLSGPMHIPVALGLLSPDGQEVMPTRVLELTETRQSYSFDGFAERPIPSILRGFSAPVILETPVPSERRAFLLAHDTDTFNKWEAGHELARDLLLDMVREGAAPGAGWLGAMELVQRDDRLEPAFRALMLRLPSEDDLAQSLAEAGTAPDPEAIHAARRRLRLALAEHLGGLLPGTHAAMNVPGPYSPDAVAAGKRALGQAALELISLRDGGRIAADVFARADNMTESLGALGCLLEADAGAAQLAAFRDRWSGDRLVMDKWFSLQMLRAAPERAVPLAAELAQHPDFDWRNPNRFRALMGALAANHAGFHASHGAGYRLLADWLIRLDPVNPQTAARMSTAFETWRRYDAGRQALMRAELERIAGSPGLSRDLAEMAARMLG
ncbi:MAG: aminopeptidase N, partial [Rhodobacteraceae bacterium]|nr:aminopeptidase N [Paracoccaceae bacterium]